MKKTLLKTLFTGILFFASLSLFSQSASLVTVISEDGAIIRKVSGNGEWAVGYSSYDAKFYNATLWNLNTYEALKLISEDDIGGAFDVSDDGKVVVGSYFGVPAYWTDGEWHELPMPEGCVFGEAHSVSSDGTAMVGRVFNQNASIAHACLWKNGELMELDLPQVDKRGDIADTNELVAISADGNTILGCLNYTMMDSRTAFVIKDGEYKMFGAEWYDEDQGGDEYNFYDVLSMSRNGKWVTGDMFYVKEIWMSEYFCPFRYDVENDVVELFVDDPEIASFSVDNDGRLYGATPLNFPIRSALIHDDGQWKLLDTWLLDNYGLDVLDVIGDTDFDELGNVFNVSADGSTVVGVLDFQTYSWVLKFDAESSVDDVISQEANPMKAVIKNGHLMLGGIVDNVKVFDIHGRVMLDNNVNGSAAIYNVSNFPAGIYVVSMTDSNKNVVNQKILINNK